MIWGSARQNKYFQRCIDKNDKDCKFFCNFISWIEITMNFGRQRVYQTYSQCLGSFNSNHSITTFLLIASYFLAHLHVMNLLVQTLKKDKNTHSKEKWKFVPDLVGNMTPYWLLMGSQLVMGASTISTLRLFWA